MADQGKIACLRRRKQISLRDLIRRGLTQPQCFLVQSNFVAVWFKSHLHLIADPGEPLIVFCHRIAYGFRYFRFDCELKRIALPHPKELFKTAAPCLHRFQHISAVPGQIAKKTNNIKKRCLATGIRTDQSAK